MTKPHRTYDLAKINKLKSHLNFEQFRIPIEFDKEFTYEDGLEKKLKEFEDYFFENILSALKEGYENVDKLGSVLSKFIDILIDTVKQYLNGDIYRATNVFFNFLDDHLTDNKELIKSVEPFSLYRGRAVSEDNNLFIEQKKMFHIPFQLRHKVSPQRYSVLGYPSLYCADSSYVVWSELNKPPFRTLNFVKLKSKEKLNLFRIMRIEDLFDEFDSELSKTSKEYKNSEYFPDETLLNYIITFPLYLACSVKKKYTKEIFNAEYIIPQLLLQYVTQNDKIDGVQYPSTKINYNEINKRKHYNYVFPVKMVKNEGYCERLKTLFNMTESTSIEKEELKKNPYMECPQFGGNMDLTFDSTIKLGGENIQSYINSSFGKIETILDWDAHLKEIKF